MDPNCKACLRFVPQWDKLLIYETLDARNVKFAYVDISIQEDKDGILMGYTPYGRSRE